MLAEGELKYYDEVKKCEEYCLFATLNPSDAGTFELAPPFLDRFGIAVPITMPSINDLELILTRRDERLFGYDELWQVPAILSEEDLLTIWNLADKVPVSSSASEYMRSLVREFGACCHFNTAKSVCNKVVIPLSVRAAKDLNRYAKAAAWLVGAGEVGVEIVKSLAPLVFWHRTRFTGDEMERAPFYGDRFAFAEHLVELASTRFAQREAAIKLMEKLRTGTADKEALNELKEMGKSDLLVKIDYVNFAKEIKKKRYVKMVQSIEKGVKDKDVGKLTDVHTELMKDTDFPNIECLKLCTGLHFLSSTSPLINGKNFGQ
ncbi:MAG: AAA family ATPase [Candidatus Thorarchaeota archaeon]|jgi:MoxR-like ATPase